jgi:hypothetical protein
LGIGGAAVLAIVVTIVVVILPKFAPLSADYTGAPVTSSDVASAGNRAVITPSEKVAFEIPLLWRDVQDYTDAPSVAASAPSGATLVGAWFTRAPTSAVVPPPLVQVMVASPSAVAPGTMTDIGNRAVDGLEESVPGIVLGASQTFETALGLEGYRADAQFEVPDTNLSGTVALIVVAHGRRFVLITWMSFQGPIDEQSLDAFMTSLRIDA